LPARLCGIYWYVTQPRKADR